MTDTEEKLEQVGKRVHLLLYGGERENDQQYTEWRGDLESAIYDWLTLSRLSEREHISEETPNLPLSIGT